jgi:hypothetical protein
LVRRVKELFGPKGETNSIGAKANKEFGCLEDSLKLIESEAIKKISIEQINVRKIDALSVQQ